MLNVRFLESRMTGKCRWTKPLRGMGAPIPRLRLILSVLVVDW